MKTGMYVRCPVIHDEEDKSYPRYFVLGQVVSVDEFAQTVKVQFHDIHKARMFYEFAFKRNVFDINEVARCMVPKNSRVVWNKQWAEVLGVKRPISKETHHVYYLGGNTGTTIEASEADFYADFSLMDYSPFQQMANYELHNPSWFLSRLVVSSSMHALNNAVYGFKTLAGCRAYLLPHQIVTVVRCLETRPVRYMLADEVGLGKTIEASAIVKILMEQNTRLKVVYVIPDPLVDQWQSELELKFKIQTSVYDGRASNSYHLIVPLSMVQTYERKAGQQLDADVLIMDETHRLLDNDQDYAAVACLSSNVENVLLLSATPIQDRKQEFLKLLTLLNPDVYANMSYQLFSDMVDKQSKIQKRVYTILSEMDDYPDYSPSIKKRLRSIAGDLSDKTLVAMIEAIDLGAEDQGRQMAGQAVAYICEHYRLERRVVRNRREMLRDKLPQRTLVTIPYRMATADELYGEAEAVENTLRWLQERQSETLDWFKLHAKTVLSAAFSSPWALRSVLKSLKIRESWLLDSVDRWCGAADAEIQSVAEVLDEPDRIYGRLVHVLDYLEQETTLGNPNADTKFLIFSSHWDTLNKMTLLLRSRLGEEVVTTFHKGMTREELQTSADLFQCDNRCRVMLCDETGGEGRNFQFAESVVHLDLPWTANALEQRIGRLDRIGRANNMSVCSVVPFTRETVEEYLLCLWGEGMEIFTQSLSGLEIITGEVNRRIETALNDGLITGLRDAQDDIINLMQEMRGTVEEEQLYDAAAMLYRPLTKTIESMLDLYQGKENEVFARAMLSWSSQAGLVPDEITNSGICSFSESRFSNGSAINALLLPPNWKDYEQLVQSYRSRKIRGTFDRSLAIQREDLLFFAPGDTIFDTIIKNAMYCCRGRASALVAYSDIDYEGLAFVWNVEPHMQSLLEAGVSTQLLSQFRAYLPMDQIFTVFPLRAAHAEVPASVVKAALLAADPEKAGHLGSRRPTKNNGSAIERFMDVYPVEKWHQLLNRAHSQCRKQAAQVVSELADLKSAAAEAKRIVDAYQATQDYFGGQDDSVMQMRHALSAVMDALIRPLITVDAVAYVKLVKKN